MSVILFGLSAIIGCPPWYYSQWSLRLLYFTRRPEHVGIGPRGFHHLRDGLEAGGFEHGPHAHTVNEFSDTLAVLSVLVPPFPELADEFFQVVVRRLELHEGHEDPAHQRAGNDRGLAAEHDGCAFLFAGPEGLGHAVDAVHAADAILVIDLEGAAVPAHALGRAHVGDFGLDVHVFGGILHLGLVDADIVPPGADDGQVGARNGRGAVVGAAGDLDLELVREGGTMEFVLELIGKRMADRHGVDVRELAAGHAHAGAGGAEAGAGSAEVPALRGDLGEDGLELVRLGTEPDQVAG